VRPLHTEIDRVGFAGGADRVRPEVDVVRPGRGVDSCVVPHRNVEKSRAVEGERSGADGRVAGTRVVAVQRSGTTGRVVVPRGIAAECKDTAGRATFYCCGGG